ncbi:MAG: presenilin family intramembrane aspartyl protease [Candidatus Woesearchaeota archaeon]
MKHNLKITLLLVVFFFISQLVGLAVTNEYIDHKVTAQTGNVTWAELPMDMERPEVEESSSYIYIFAAIIIGTLLVLLIIRTGAYRMWKLWFFLAVLITLTMALGAFINEYAAFAIALALALWKIYRPNIYIHNITETLVYGGLAAILVPIINLKAMLILLVLVSLYDMYAVWRSKHMVRMAKFQTESKIFAGLFIPYKKVKRRAKTSGKKPEKVKRKKGTAEERAEGRKSAILGGGDIGFPLLFAGVVMKNLMLTDTVLAGFLKTAIIPVVVSIALLLLFLLSKEDRYYPAMPFLSIGCVTGYLLIILIQML